MTTDNASPISRREFLKAFSVLGAAGLAAAVPTARTLAAKSDASPRREACVGESGYARRLTDLFERAPIKRIDKKALEMK
ncbi:MAG: hypothetical protein Fur0018_09570 [Anaerolineales bacterium]